MTPKRPKVLRIPVEDLPITLQAHIAGMDALKAAGWTIGPLIGGTTDDPVRIVPLKPKPARRRQK